MNTAITKTVYGTLAVLALVAIGLWAQSPDLTITPDEPEVVPEMTLNRAAGWVVVIDGNTKVIRVEWETGYHDTNGDFVAVKSHEKVFQNEEVGPQYWDLFMQGRDYTIPAAMPITLPGGGTNTLPAGTTIQVGGVGLLRVIVDGLKAVGEL